MLIYNIYSAQTFVIYGHPVPPNIDRQPLASEAEDGRDHSQLSYHTNEYLAKGIHLLVQENIWMLPIL